MKTRVKGLWANRDWGGGGAITKFQWGQPPPL